MKKRMTALLLSACMCAGLAGCGTNTPGNNPGHTKPDSSVTSLTDNISVTSVKTDITSFDQLKNGINEFSMNMYSALPADKNIFYSPYSIASAMSMLDVGADGATKKELENALGITDLDEWNDEMKAYLSKNWSQNTFVNTANSVWMNKDTSWSADIEKDFLTPAKDYYSGEVYEADFNGQPDKVVQNVNNWVSTNTNKMIPEILKEIPGGTVMMLINAVYFEGKWDTPFTEDKTFQSSFYGTDKESVVDMMHLYGEHFTYMDNGEIKGITLPYDGDNVVMKVFMPTADDGDINELFDKLSNEEKQKLIDSLDNANNVEIDTLQLPKFTDEQSIDGLDRQCGTASGVTIQLCKDDTIYTYFVIERCSYINRILTSHRIYSQYGVGNVQIADVNRFLKQFEQSKKMMKQMSGMMGGKRRRGGFKMPFGLR